MSPKQSPVPVEQNVPKHEGSRPFGPLEFVVRYKGVFDLQGLYSMMANWLMKYSFYFHETSHKCKTPGLEVDWEAYRKKTGFVMEKITVYIHAFTEDVDVVEDGVKKRMSKGRLTVRFSGSTETAYSDIYGKKRFNTPFQRRLLKFYNDVIMKRELDFMYEDVLYYELYNFQTAVKEYLNMYARGSAY